jgi:ParB-like chromosome segregation protein Spo0J
MKTETVSIDSISLDPANVRRHPDRNIQTIVASLKRFGQQKPIVVTKEGIVIAGNGTLQAARHLGWKQIEIVRTGLTGSDATAYAIADNRTAELAEWDDDALAQTLAALQIEDEKLALDTGFDASEIASIGVPDFGAASIDEQGKLDEKAKCRCPECGHEFTP